MEKTEKRRRDEEKTEEVYSCRKRERSVERDLGGALC